MASGSMPGAGNSSKLAWLEVNFRAGVRVAFDYLGKDLKAQRSNDNLLAIENLLREQEAFWSLRRYVHSIAMKPV